MKAYKAYFLICCIVISCSISTVAGMHGSSDPDYDQQGNLYDEIDQLVDLCNEKQQLDNLLQAQIPLRNPNYTEKNHVDYEHDTKRFCCGICLKSFSHKSSMITHIRSKHTDPAQKRYFSCPYPNCNKRYTTNSGLEYHKKKHAGLYNYQCPYCEKKFIKKSQVILHQRMHTGLFIPCDRCPRLFASMSALNKHKGNAH